MLKTAPIFSDHMVLQREVPVPVWGTAAPGAAVTASLDAVSARCAADGEGRWALRLPPLPAGGPHTLTVESGGDTLAFSDVLMGDVWLAGGQSNMELELRNAKDAAKEMAESDLPTLRFYNVPKCAVAGEELDRAEAEARWQVCSPATSAAVSAVAYFFAREIVQARNVPVGIVDCYWGGTSISCWLGREALSRTPVGRKYLDRWAELVGDKTDEQYYKELDEYYAQWNEWDQRVQARRAVDPDITWEVLNKECGLCPWPPPPGWPSPYRPAGLYETMISRVAPYALKGFLYYQGEEDQERFHAYAGMMEQLIAQWRGDWGDESLPFLFVQLPMYCSREEFEAGQDSKYWALLRDAQFEVCRRVQDVGLAVIADCGEFDNIHPLDKQTVGRRLALQARRKVYGEDVEADAPVFAAALPSGGRMQVLFRHTGGGLVLRDGPTGFELAGADGVFHPAGGTASGDTAILTSPEVPAPVYVRYAWTNYGPAALYGGTGLAAAPFRSDDLPVPETGEAASWRF